VKQIIRPLHKIKRALYFFRFFSPPIDFNTHLADIQQASPQNKGTSLTARAFVNNRCENETAIELSAKS
jgi:hypothetical protein